MLTKWPGIYRLGCLSLLMAALVIAGLRWIHFNNQQDALAVLRETVWEPKP